MKTLTNIIKDESCLQPKAENVARAGRIIRNGYRSQFKTEEGRYELTDLATLTATVYISLML